MTVEEFDTTGFTGGMKVEINKTIYDVASVDFEDKTIGIEIDGDIEYTHCRHCEFVKNDS